MNYLSTTQTSVTFTNASGVTKTIVKNYIWYRINEDTVTFLVLPDADPGGDGTCFFASKIEDLTINGTVYTAQTIVEALDDIFEPVNVSDVYTKEQIDDMLDNYAELTDLDQFIDATELATALADYQEKLTAGTGITIQNNVISATGGGGSVTVDSTWIPNSTNPAESQLIQSSLADKADKSTTYTKTETDNLLAGKVSTGTLATVASSGSYTDLTNTPTIPAAQIQSSWTESDTTSKAYIQGKPNFAAVATSGAYSDLSGTPDLSTKQDTLVSGTNIKTINNESLLGSGNITITGGGSSVTVDSTWIPNSTNPVESQLIQSALADKANSSSLATVATSGAYSDLSGKPTNVSTFTNDAGYLTSHQSLADVFGDVLYDSQTKHINFYGKGDTQHTTVLAYVDAANFIVDGMVDTVEVKNATVSGQTVLCLVISFNTDAGKQDINIPISQIFDATNYYDKTDVDDLVAEAKPYYYEIGDTTEESYNEAYDAFREQRGIVLYGGSPSVYYPVTYTYANGTFRFTYLDSETGNVTIYSATHTDSRNTKSAGTVTWTQEAADNYELYYYELGNTDVDAFDGVVFGVDDNERALILFEDDGGRIHRYPASCSYDDVANTLYIGYTDVEGMPQAYTVTKQSGDAKAPASYEIVWEDVSPDFGVTIDSTWVQNSTNPAESQLIQSALGNKQDTLVSGTNIKTINNESILGSGNITISGGGSGTVTGVKMNNGSAINPDANGVVDLGTVVTTVDSALNASSTNPVENRAVYAAIGDIETALQILNGTNSNS